MFYIIKSFFKQDNINIAVFQEFSYEINMRYLFVFRKILGISLEHFGFCLSNTIYQSNTESALRCFKPMRRL